MTRFRLHIEYDGSSFHGWQRQDNGPTIQGALEEALFRLSQTRTEVQGAGRTDAGVHALNQVAHVDLALELSPDKLRDAINFYLRPAPISVLRTEVVAPDFHARFDAKARHYVYRIYNRRAPLALDRQRAWWIARELDAERMNEAAQALVGQHDFTSFRASICQAASPVKTLDYLKVTRQGEEIWIQAGARSFLHHQVRNIVGTLEKVGQGKWEIPRVEAVLTARDRNLAGPTAPPDGLFLTRVDYDL